MELKVEIYDAALKRKLAKIVSPEAMKSLNKAIGIAVLERTKDHLAQMSVSRHKTADWLGASHTGYYEHAAGRTALQNVDADGATVVVQNTPGLSRAFHDLDIKPTGGRKWLTIPINRIAYGKRVKDLRGEGHALFRPGKARILAEARGKGKKGKLRPLYALVKNVRVPRDEGLLPSVKDLRNWSVEAAQNYLDAAAALDG